VSILPCRSCGGEGRVYKSRYGGNDPDVWDAGPCEACSGTGNQTCECCGREPATVELTHLIGRRSTTEFLCSLCDDEGKEGLTL